MQSHVLFENYLWRRERFHPSNGLFPVILRSSKSIYNEALPILYGENVFSISLVNEANPHAAAIKMAYLAVGLPHRGNVEKEEALKLAPFLDKHSNLTQLDIKIAPNLEFESDVQDILTNALLRTGYTGKFIARCPKSRRSGKIALENTDDSLQDAPRSISEGKSIGNGTPIHKSLMSLVDEITSTLAALPELSSKFGLGARDWDKKTASIHLYLAMQHRMSRVVDPERVNALFKMSFSRRGNPEASCLQISDRADAVDVRARLSRFRRGRT